MTLSQNNFPRVSQSIHAGMYRMKKQRYMLKILLDYLNVINIHFIAALTGVVYFTAQTNDI